jgi:3-hydroxy acid dehydrogenase / malonic semialdehyde reductase
MKTAIVTGASSGIGQAIAAALVNSGWQVISVGRSVPDAGIEHIACDFSKLIEVELIARQLAKREFAIELVVCAAGTGKFASAEGFSAQQIEEVMRVNFTSHAVLLGSLLPSMKKRRSGKVVVIGSEAALQGSRLGSIYCASKFALRGYCQSLRVECRSAGIGVSLINPGLVRTAFHDQQHFEPAAGKSHALTIADVCACVMLTIELPAYAVAEEINLQPMQPLVAKK